MYRNYQLTDAAVRKFNPGSAPVKLTDGMGLYLHVTPTGGKLWRYAYRFRGKQKLMALGCYPDVSLAQARQRHQDARKLVADNVDPTEARKAEREAQKAKDRTFRMLYQVWFNYWKVGKKGRHVSQTERRINADVLPVLGDKAPDEVTAAHIRGIMAKIMERGARDVAKRIHEYVSSIFRYGVVHELCKRNPAADFKPNDILPTVETENFARVSVKEIPALLKKMDEYKGTAVTKLAMRLLALTWVRTSELIEAPWDEFDIEAARWDIPAERMKKRRPHIVPLSKQAVEVLKALKMLTGTKKVLFPGDRENEFLSNNTILKALERMGFKGEMTGHGYRGLASTVLYESGKFEEDWIEMQLAHVKKDKTAAAYNHAKYLKQRTKMMQWWGDYIDQQRQKAGDIE
jgi:integrase